MRLEPSPYWASSFRKRAIRHLYITIRKCTGYVNDKAYLCLFYRPTRPAPDLLTDSRSLQLRVHGSRASLLHLIVNLCLTLASFAWALCRTRVLILQNSLLEIRRQKTALCTTRGASSGCSCSRAAAPWRRRGVLCNARVVRRTETWYVQVRRVTNKAAARGRWLASEDQSCPGRGERGDIGAATSLASFLFARSE